MKIYLAQDERVEELISMIEDLYPGKVVSRVCLEVETEDKTIGAFLQGMTIGNGNGHLQPVRRAAAAEGGGEAWAQGEAAGGEGG